MSIETRKLFLIRLALAALATGALLQQPATATEPATTKMHSKGTVLQMRREHTGPSRAMLRLPRRGTSMQQVLARHGEPQTRHAAIGEPPITRWDYAKYSLYFERNLLLHAVVPGDPVPLQHKEQLSAGHD
ncbi:MAG TPA: hypothetical protein VK110_04945 [Salinisphaeraceae bacterium]|nr:hypothetical protein [Salinisphaeraceae bacterium]